MFEKLSQLAEQAAASVSRRQFLGRFGRAAALAAAAGALLAQPALARRQRGQCSNWASDIGCQGWPVGHACGAVTIGDKVYPKYCHGITEIEPGYYSCDCATLKNKP